jgi:hypothetical protein
MKIRIKCISYVWKEGLKDPDLTTGKFYDLLDGSVFVMGEEAMYSFVGDNKVEIQRPKYIFQVFGKV